MLSSYRIGLSGFVAQRPKNEGMRPSTRPHSAATGASGIQATFYALKRFCRAATKTLRSFYQFHLAVFFSMQNFHPAFHITKDKYVAVAEFRFLHCFFQRQWLM
jgi:hypothetical protein